MTRGGYWLADDAGVVNQAITRLEIQTDKEQAFVDEKNVTYPEKVTLKWLYQHAPVSSWEWLAGIIISVFALGIAFSETPLYKSLKVEKENVIIESKKN